MRLNRFALFTLLVVGALTVSSAAFAVESPDWHGKYVDTDKMTITIAPAYDGTYDLTMTGTSADQSVDLMCISDGAKATCKGTVTHLQNGKKYDTEANATMAAKLDVIDLDVTMKDKATGETMSGKEQLTRTSTSWED